MKTEKELREEVRRIQERVKLLSGFWIGEAASAIYALEWAMEKREAAPSEDLVAARGGREKIATALVKLVEKAPARSVRKVAPKKPGTAPATRAEGTTGVKPRSKPSRPRR